MSAKDQSKSNVMAHCSTVAQSAAIKVIRLLLSLYIYNYLQKFIIWIKILQF